MSFTPGGGNPVDAGFVADLTEALGYIANSGVGVVNMSLGTTRHHPPLQDAIARWLAGAPKPPTNLRLSVDIDPQSFL